jgi:hypothetical protein
MADLLWNIVDDEDRYTKPLASNDHSQVQNETDIME